MFRDENPRVSRLESQDDLGYLLGRHTAEDVQRQIRSTGAQPDVRKSGAPADRDGGEARRQEFRR